MTVIVTDHHEVPYRDTESGREWVIPSCGRGDRSQAACLFISNIKSSAGAAVAWKLIWALYEKNGIPEEEILEFAEIAAIATVGDVMDLQGENRIIVKEGLKRLPHTANKGLRAPYRGKRAGREQDNRLSCGVCPGSLHQTPADAWIRRPVP